MRGTDYKYTREETKQQGIYCIQNILEPTKYYIGSAARSFRERWNKHIYDLRKNKHNSPKLQNAWNKYGEDIFIYKILEVVPKEEWTDNKYLTDIEQLYLDTYLPFYNISKIAGSPLGVKHTVEAKYKMSLAKKGKPLSEETKKKISKIHKENPYWKGRKHTEETKAKISKGKLGTKHQKQNSKYIYEVITPDLERVTIPCLLKFCEQHNLNYSGMRRVLKGLQKDYKSYKCKRVK